jgi:hypothetical protein
MVPSTESTPEGSICPVWEVFPVAGNASDDHHSLVLLIGGLLVAQPCSDPCPSTDQGGGKAAARQRSYCLAF